MKTTLNLPEELLLDAMKATNIKTKTKVIIIALEDLIRKNKISELKNFKGKVALVRLMRNTIKIKLTK